MLHQPENVPAAHNYLGDNHEFDSRTTSLYFGRKQFYTEKEISDQIKVDFCKSVVNVKDNGRETETHFFFLRGEGESEKVDYIGIH